MGVTAAETRNVERRVPADPVNLASQEVIEPHAGQAWLPDSSHKTGRGSKTAGPPSLPRAEEDGDGIQTGRMVCAGSSSTRTGASSASCAQSLTIVAMAAAKPSATGST
jgi:hypothetical protein